ncbi:uncharacterized protein LOC117590449 [Drosophila guanche]|uniref:Uncharacterized protein n=1 Tax=Drosophila guanche TaxID=7266 RepID=A0A3B0K5V5_DROGU|nr:uncharacterized protein LOC117590449 [Drosophila guanche]SPP88663.1 Hypothetical predicted protein [Drosophila guanche]
MMLPELLLLLGLAMSMSMSDAYDGSVNYWEAFAPGKLLQRLDALTLTDVDQSKLGKLPEMIQVLAETQENAQAEPKADEDADVADDEVDSLSAETSREAQHSGEDYERNYEQFVKEYFDRAASDDGDADADANDGSRSLEQTHAEASNHKNQRCRRVRKQGQLCEICREAKNNQVSETCSYSNSDKPEKYAYDTGSQYKRYRDDSADNDNDDDDSQQEAVAGEDKEESAAASSLCVRRLQGKRVCYQCKDSKGQRLQRCYDMQEKRRMNKATSSAAAPTTKSKSKISSKRKPRARQSQQSEQEQRIYKRTISYSYAQGSSPNDEEEQPPLAELTTTAATLPAKQHRRRRLVKVLRRRGPVP